MGNEASDMEKMILITSDISVIEDAAVVSVTFAEGHDNSGDEDVHGGTRAFSHPKQAWW